jgi:hypothetical protein
VRADVLGLGRCPGHFKTSDPKHRVNVRGRLKSRAVIASSRQHAMRPLRPRGVDDLRSNQEDQAHQCPGAQFSARVWPSAI